MPTFDIGDGVRFKVTFRDLDLALADPTTITVVIEDPSGNQEALEFGVDGDVIKASTGIFYVDRTMDESGLWRHRWDGVGALIAAQEDSVTVRTRQVN